MRHSLHVKRPSLWLTSVLTLLLGLCATSCAASGAQPLSQVHSSAATPTPRVLRQNYVYLSENVLLDGSPQATQAHWGQTLTITWMAHAYNQSANPSPITLSLLVYGPFSSQAELVDRMQIGSGIGATPAPITQLAFQPAASASEIDVDTWTTAAQASTFRIPASLPAGRYDFVSLSMAGSTVVERRDTAMQVG